MKADVQSINIVFVPTGAAGYISEGVTQLENANKRAH